MKKIRVCGVGGCNNKYYARNCCLAHYERRKRYGSEYHYPPKQSINERRLMRGTVGRCNDRDYWLVLSPCHPKSNNQGYVFEHRLIMEVELGRFLDTKEIIHHIDHDRGNNNIENLELTNHANHNRHHNKVRRLPSPVFPSNQH